MPEPASEAKVRVAVIGAGGIARSAHLPSLAEMDDVEVVAICDQFEDKARQQAERFGIPRVYTLYRRMLEDERENVDAVYCLVEPANLFLVTVWSLHAGYPVFMEKPPGLDAYQCASLARRADEAGGILQVGFNRRHIPLLREIKRRFAEAGGPNQVEGCFYKYGSGAFDHGSMSAFASDTIHAIDLVRWLAGGRAVAAATVAGSSDEPIDNRWSSVVRFDNGVNGILKGNYRTGGRVHKFEVHAPALSAYVNLGFGTAACDATLLTHRGDVRYSLAARGAEEQAVERLDGIAMAGGDAFHRYYGFYHEDRHFIDCVRQGRRPETSIHDAVETMRLTERLVQSVI